jgi:hypothetical protein
MILIGPDDELDDELELELDPAPLELELELDPAPLEPQPAAKSARLRITTAPGLALNRPFPRRLLAATPRRLGCIISLSFLSRSFRGFLLMTPRRVRHGQQALKVSSLLD